MAAADLLTRERELWARGYRRVAGVDEVGRGALAGPVVAAAVILPAGLELPGVNDSKKVPPARRVELAGRIRAAAEAVGVGAASPREIDRLGIGEANWRAMRQALAALEPTPQFVLTDGRRIPLLTWPQEARPKGDASHQCIAAASIVAKVARDRLMERLDARYPLFGFARHKGYGTEDHLAALREHGPSPWHRRSFEWDGSRAAAERARREDLHAVGCEGEELAARWLVERGFRLVERNFRFAGAEVDLIAWDGGELVFVEVKLRRGRTHGGGAEAVTAAKQRRIARAAAGFMARHGCPSSPCRFDVVAIDSDPANEGGPRVVHLRNAFAGSSERLV